MRGKYRPHHILEVVLLFIALAGFPASNSKANENSKYLDAVREFADNVLEHGRDTYGPKHTPLFVDGLNIHTHEPVKWIAPNGDRWILSNLASQQNLFRTLDGLTRITGDSKYKQAAMDAIKYAFENLQRPDGLLYWGAALVYDAQTDRPHGKNHSLRITYPYYELMWEVDSSFTRQFIEAFWSAHILDWSNLEMNRFAVNSERFDNPWQHEYKGGPVFFHSKKWNATPFLGAGSDMYYAAALLSKLSGEEEPLVWSKRLAHRYVETRNANTGISGTIYCLRDDTPAQDQFGDDFRGHVVNMGTLFPAAIHGEYVHPVQDQEVPQITRTGRKGFGVQGGQYGGFRAWLCQFLLGEIMGDDGKEFTRWALEELTARGRVAYRKKDNSFIPMLTDGTSLEGYVFTKDGLYGPKGTTLKSRWASYIHFWAYAVGYRLTADEFMWEMARSIAEGNGFGDIGTLANNKPKLAMDTDCSEPHALLGFLELYSKTQNDTFLSMASRIGDNILAERFHRGFFVPTKKHLYTRFDYLEPLVLLRLEAAVRKTPTLTPQVWPGASYFMYDYRRIIKAVDVDVIYTLTESSELPISLPEASAGGDIDEVRSLIAKGADVNAWDTSKKPPLNFAAMNGHKQVVELLIAKGADVNAGDSGSIKPLHRAAENGHKEIAELLIAHGADVNATRRSPAGVTPLYSAVKAGHRDIVELLIAKGADVNVKNVAGQTPVDIAVNRNRSEVVELLIEGGADISLHVSAYQGDLDKVRSFIEKGTDVNAMDSYGATPLHYAAVRGSRVVVEFLISRGVQANTGDKNGITPQHFAAGGGHKDIVQILIANGADVNVKDIWGGTPLNYAADEGREAVVRLLLTKGADVNAADRWGSTALSFAKKRGHTEIVEFLRKHGAKE